MRLSVSTVRISRALRFRFTVISKMKVVSWTKNMEEDMQ